jgi:hypothetical protein
MPANNWDLFNRERAIAMIEQTFAPDSMHPQARAIGLRLLEQAREDCDSWRNERNEVVMRLAELCVAEVKRQESAAQRAREAGL